MYITGDPISLPFPMSSTSSPVTLTGLHILPLNIHILSVDSQKDVIAVQRCSIENQKGAIAVQSHMAIAPFWFSTEHLWSAITPFWLSTDYIVS